MKPDIWTLLVYRRTTRQEKNLMVTATKLEKIKASMRAKVERSFRIIKQQFGYNKIRYRGLEKKHARFIPVQGSPALFDASDTC